MIQKKNLTIFVVLVIGITPLLQNFATASEYFDSPLNNAPGLPESHIIENVPYVGQDGPYCAYASITMVFKYYGIDTTEHEVLYNSGAGHSFAYNTPLGGGVHLSFSPTDRTFLASLYGLSYEIWGADIKNLSDDECWNEYWTKVKQNISQDIPVVTSVNPFVMPVMKNLTGTPNWLLRMLSALNITLPSSHDITLVGYNESNQTVCYNDPAAGIWHETEKGAYAWADIRDFKKAVNTAIGMRYQIEIFIDTPANPLNKTEIYERAHERNIERMKGNKSAYDEGYSKYSLGINGLKELRKDLGTIKYRLPTIIVYKIKGTMYRNLCHIFKTVELWRTTLFGLYEYMPLVKKHLSNYLNENYNLSDKCVEEARLLESEAENFSDLDSYVLEFSNMRLSQVLYPRIIICKMIKSLDNIIAIEEEIIKSAV